MYPWGSNNIKPEHANWGQRDNKIDYDRYPLQLKSIPYSTPVGFYGAQGKYGLCDMSGNISEWCQDKYYKYYYESSPTTNPSGPIGGRFRVLRGGCWDYANERAFQTSAREWNLPICFGPNYGFRVCATTLNTNLRKGISISTVEVSPVSTKKDKSSTDTSSTVNRAAQDIIIRYRSDGETFLQRYNITKVQKDPSYRIEIIEHISNQLLAYEDDYEGEDEIVALWKLDAIEALPGLIHRWNSIEKNSIRLESADPRILLLRTITHLLPTDESIEFLIKVKSDEEEHPRVRFRATILLCSSGNEKAVQCVLDAYNRAKLQYPNQLIKNGKTTVDHDDDQFNDIYEPRLLLDPSSNDTDGDGIIDGKDRNPLSASEKNLTESQRIAHFLFAIVHPTYLYSGLSVGTG